MSTTTPPENPAPDGTAVAVPDLGDAQAFQQGLAPCTAPDVARWVMVSLLEDSPREHGVAPAFANGCIKGVTLALEEVLPYADTKDPELGVAVRRVARLFRSGMGARS